jgi:hypothetical protein
MANVNRLHAYAQAALRQRFSDRVEFTWEEAYQQLFASPDLPQAGVFECFGLIELEYGIPAGVLRPDDSLDELFAPIPTKHPWWWMVYQVQAGDREAEILRQVDKRLRRHGQKLRGGLRTIGDLIHAWCGHWTV